MTAVTILILNIIFCFWFLKKVKASLAYFFSLAISHLIKHQNFLSLFHVLWGVETRIFKF